MEPRDAAQRWRDTWQRGWNALEPGPVIALYREDAHYQSHPFREPERPADYITRAMGEETSAQCEFGEPVVDGGWAAVEWGATTTLADGGGEVLRGLSLLHFDDEGMVVEQRDFWAQA